MSYNKLFVSEIENFLVEISHLFLLHYYQVYQYKSSHKKRFTNYMIKFLKIQLFI